MNKLEIFLSEVEPYQIEQMEGYRASYQLTIDFHDGNECIGVLRINFDAIGYGVEGFDGGIDVSYQIMYFNDPSGKKDLLEDYEAFVFIFSNYGKQIENIVDTVYDAIDEYYLNGTPISIYMDVSSN